MTPFRSEKNSNWEGAYRVPAMVRWPGKIKPGQVSNEIVAHHDLLPTILAMAGDPQVTEKLPPGYKIGDMTYKVHLDGYNLVPYLTGQDEKSPRESFIYVNDDQQLTALRYDNWKIVFMEQRASGQLLLWAEPFTEPARSEDLQSPHRSLRAGGHHLEHLLRLANRSRVPARARAGLRGPVPGIVQGIPAAAEGGQLQPGRSHGEDEGGELTRRLTHCGPTLARYRRTAEERFFDKQECRRQKTLSFVVSPQNAKWEE